MNCSKEMKNQSSLSFKSSGGGGEATMELSILGKDVNTVRVGWVEVETVIVLCIVYLLIKSYLKKKIW